MAALRARIWPAGTLLRVRWLGGTPAQRSRARAEAVWWSEASNVHFAFDDAPDAELRVAFRSDEPAWAYIGTDARRVPMDQPTMNLGAAEAGAAAHGFGHALGLTHTRQNPAGGTSWNVDAMLRDLAGPPLHWDRERVLAYLNSLRNDSRTGTMFDPGSVMLEFHPADWTTSRLAVRRNAVLSAHDKVQAAQLYSKISLDSDD